MAGKDYYIILGVERSAPAHEIKKAYRKLAQKYHPDKTKGNKKLEEKFKEVNEAYAVLSDPEKRKQFDTFGADGFNQRFSQEDIFSGFDVGSIFSEFGFSGSGAGGDFFSSLFGGRKGPSAGRGFGGGYDFRGQSTAPKKGQDIEYHLTISLEEAFTGSKKNLSISNLSQSIAVTIPKGIGNNQKLRLSGKGHPSPQGGANGDLFLKVQIRSHPQFRRQDNDLTLLTELSLTQAILGTKIEVPTIDGTTIKLKIPPGTQPGTKLRIKGKGMPIMKKDSSERGSAFVEITVKLPQEITQEQKIVFEQLQAEGL